MDEKTGKLTRIKKFAGRYLYVLILAFPFIAIDIFMRLIGSEINYFQWKMVIPNLLFNAMWIGLVLGLALNVNRTFGKVIYLIFFIFYFIMFFANGIYYYYTGLFFNFNLITMASEGSSYIWDTVTGAKPVVYVMAVSVIIVAAVSLRMFPKEKVKARPKRILIVLGVFILLHIVTPFLMGYANKELEWDTWRNPHNIYDSFSDVNKSMKVCGLYEFVFRDFYITFLKPEEKENEDDLTFLEGIYSNPSEAAKNEYTGIFEGKNVIFLQLEGIDSWLLNSEDMPNLHGLMSKSMIFSNHYSYYNGGGSTFNSELAVNTGFITPVSYTQNAYTFNKNKFDHSLANIFKNMGYSVNAFHMNTREYYSRGINYDNWGYDHYYGLLDEKKYNDLSYELDRELILNENFYNRMFRKDEPFLHYIITYTPHTPFTTAKGMGKLLAQTIYGEDAELPDLSEEESARMYAGETDYMVGLLMEALKENELYENTVIVAYADHYLYTLNDKTILDKYKDTENNLINKTPFFIWSSDFERATYIEKVNSQIDILPTVLNLFGIEYAPEYYMGRDIIDKSYKGYVFFSDYSWYDGNAYVEGGEVSNGAVMDAKALEEMNTLINDLVRKNDMTLKYDYFRRIYKSTEKATKDEALTVEGEDETSLDSMEETDGEAVE
ncbi:MAG: LTA synthase family protein [Lachnospiraceae bacterium]